MPSAQTLHYQDNVLSCHPQIQPPRRSRSRRSTWPGIADLLMLSSSRCPAAADAQGRLYACREQSSPRNIPPHPPKNQPKRPSSWNWGHWELSSQAGGGCNHSQRKGHQLALICPTLPAASEELGLLRNQGFIARPRKQIFSPGDVGQAKRGAVPGSTFSWGK